MLNRRILNRIILNRLNRCNRTIASAAQVCALFLVGSAIGSAAFSADSARPAQPVASSEGANLVDAAASAEAASSAAGASRAERMSEAYKVYLRKVFEQQVSARHGWSSEQMNRPLRCFDEVMNDTEILKCTKSKFNPNFIDRQAEQRIMTVCQYSSGIGARTCLRKVEASDHILKSRKGLRLEFNCAHDALAVDLCADSHEQHILKPQPLISGGSPLVPGGPFPSHYGKPHVYATACFEHLQNQANLEPGVSILSIHPYLHAFLIGLGQELLDSELILACQSSVLPRPGRPSVAVCAGQSIDSRKDHPGRYESNDRLAKQALFQCKGAR